MSAEALSLPFPEPAGPSVVVHHGDCLDVLRGMADASVDAVVTDPPYELGFMGRKWDASGIAYSVDLWRDVLRVLKPGGHLLAFGGTRTYHRMTCAIEDAGFEIRDTIAWMYGQGFPKSHNLDGAHKGWGTALKPAHEPVTVARKPLVGTVAANVLAHGTGALNVDGCRVEHVGPPIPVFAANKKDRWIDRDGVKIVATGETRTDGRWPANVVLDEDAAAVLDAQSGVTVSGSRVAGVRHGLGFHGASGDGGPAISGDSGGASRFFYCAKASGKERFAALICDCEALHSDAWESADREQSEPTGCTSPARVTSGATSTDECGSLTSSNGSATTGQSQPDTTSTTRTRTSKTTPSETSLSSTPQLTSACTPGASYEAGHGGSRAASVASSNQLTESTSTSPRKGGRSTGVAAVVTSRESSKPSVCAKCGAALRREQHPTQKPLALMRWLVRLVTPPGGTVLDPFAGSGTTLVAAKAEGFNAIGIEREAEYVEIIKARVGA